MTGLPPGVKAAVAKLPDVTRDVVAQRMRDAKLPAVYSALVVQIKQCEDLLQLDYFSDAAAALAAYAIIHRDTKLMQQAKRLKLWAAWAAGRAAAKLRPGGYAVQPRSGLKRPLPGARSLLLERGMSVGEAAHITRLSRLSDAEISEAMRGESVPSSRVLARRGVGRGANAGAPSYSAHAAGFISGGGGGGGGGLSGNLCAHAGFCRRNDAKRGSGFTLQEAKRARELMREIQEWHDAFEQVLPK